MNWDDLRYFLVVAREKQMLSAARRLGVSQALLSRHMASLEAAVGKRLLDRSTRGCTLTEDGKALFATAETIEGEVLSGLSALGTREDITGTVRIGAPDGFGSAYLAPRLGEFHAAYPELHIQLVPVAHSFSLSEREADVAVMVGRPKRGRLRVRKLTDYTLGLYASRSYFSDRQVPTSLSDLTDHNLVGYVEDLIYSPDLEYFDEISPAWRSNIEVATAVGQFQAVCAGAGIGICHDFMAHDVPHLVPLFPKRRITRSYWIAWHENLCSAARITAFVDYLGDIVRTDHALFLPISDAAR